MAITTLLEKLLADEIKAAIEEAYRGACLFGRGHWTLQHDEVMRAIADPLPDCSPYRAPECGGVVPTWVERHPGGLTIMGADVGVAGRVIHSSMCWYGDTGFKRRLSAEMPLKDYEPSSQAIEAEFKVMKDIMTDDLHKCTRLRWCIQYDISFDEYQLIMEGD